jgi:hypothetical protein
MATLADMKARLAAIKQKQEQEKQNVQTSAVADTRGSIADDATPQAEISSNVPAVVEVAIQTDLQPTTLVVVERPVELPAVGKSQVSDTVLQATETQLDTGNPVHAGFLQRLADLESCLLARDPLMKTHLGMIHKTMIEYEEIANLLTIAEIRAIMEAQQVHTGVVLRTEVVKSSKAAATRKSAQIKLEDI